MGLGHRWPEIARTYREVNDLFGDIVKVTPSSKVVGDMALFLFTRGIKPADVVNLPPGTSWPESVIDMLSGGLGEPMGGWPPAVVKAVLGTAKTEARQARAGEAQGDEGGGRGEDANASRARTTSTRISCIRASSRTSRNFSASSAT